MTDPEELVRLDQKLQVFALDGWRRIEEELTRRLEGYTDRLVYGDNVSPEQRELLRGQAKEVKWLLDLPEDTYKNREYLMEQMEEAAQEPE